MSLTYQGGTIFQTLSQGPFSFSGTLDPHGPVGQAYVFNFNANTTVRPKRHSNAQRFCAKCGDLEVPEPSGLALIGLASIRLLAPRRTMNADWGRSQLLGMR